MSWNQAAEQLFGWTEHEALGQHAIHFLRAKIADPITVEAVQAELFHTGKWHGDMIHHHKDDSPILVTATITEIYDHNEDDVTRYVVVLRDITEKTEVAQTLKVTEERYRIISELMTDYAYMSYVDEDGNLTPGWKTEKAFTKITGYGIDELQGTLNLYHPDEVEQVKADVAKTIAGEDTEAEYRIITKNGEDRWIYIHRRVLWDETGTRVIGFYGAGKDITARKEKDEKLLEYRREQDQVRVLQEFIRDASHDLKTPLSTINTSIYLLRQYSQDEKQHNQIDKLESHVQRLVTLIDDMFEMSRLDLAKHVHLDKVNINQYLKDFIRVYQSIANGKQIQIVDELSLEPLIIDADMSSMQQAISNILENAIIFSPEKSQIHVRAYAKDDRICIDIQDHGIGIPADEIPHIFERFYRVDKSRHTGSIASTGLGLAIAKKVVDLHSGAITVDSEVSKGSTFTICLPQNAP